MMRGGDPRTKEEAKEAGEAFSMVRCKFDIVYCCFSNSCALDMLTLNTIDLFLFLLTYIDL
jgi:hypothetical protein